MRVRMIEAFRKLTLAQRFLIASSVILVAGMSGIGWWVGQQIEAGVVHRSAATTALYVDSLIAPDLQELAAGDAITAEHIQSLSGFLQDTELGHEIAAFKVWSKQGQILYSNEPTMVGRSFPIKEDLTAALHGEVHAQISNLDDEENVVERLRNSRLLEIYTPVRLRGTNQVIAVAEFYQSVEDLQNVIGQAQRTSWLIVGTVTLLMYLLLGSFVQRASDTIEQQRLALSTQVTQLTELLRQNQELHERVQRAAIRTTALNERFLRRISAELHDGPAQDLSLALLRLDPVLMHCGSPLAPANGDGNGSDHSADPLEVIQSSLQRALSEIRAISAGLGLPQLSNLTLAQTVARVVRTHERRTGSKVALNLGKLPEQAPLPVKITLYRVLQEALSNAHRHAGGVGQQVCVQEVAGMVNVEISDQGPGFDGTPPSDSEEHLGLVGMRERVESLGGHFGVETQAGQGTRVQARFALSPADGVL